MFLIQNDSTLEWVANVTKLYATNTLQAEFYDADLRVFCGQVLMFPTAVIAEDVQQLLHQNFPGEKFSIKSVSLSPKEVSNEAV